MRKGRFSKNKEWGTWEIYHKNGQVRTREFKINGKSDGFVETYDSNGSLVSIETDGEVIDLQFRSYENLDFKIED